LECADHVGTVGESVNNLQGGSRLPGATSERGETGVTRSSKFLVRSSEHFSLQTFSLVLRFSQVSRVSHE
jgi:hypothetical protein